MLMKMQYTKLTHVLAVTCLALTLTAMGCGDDEGDTPVAGTGGAGAGGAAGTTAGTGGAKAGTGGTGGNAPTMAECVTKTSAILTPARMACTSCVCTKGLSLATACANDANCWPLISCVGASGCESTDTTCITTACGPYLAGAGPAMPFGAPIVRAMCSAECVTSGADGGADDAGL
jgi:hypothetical protein